MRTDGRSVCTKPGTLIVLMTISTFGFSAAAVGDMVVRFAPGILAPPAGRTTAALDEFSFADTTLREDLRREGVVRLARAFPTFRLDENPTNFVGEPIVLEDLSLFYLVTLQAPEQPATEAALRAVRGVHDVGRVQALELLSACFPQPSNLDPLLVRQWGLHNTGDSTICSSYSGPRIVADMDINAPEAWCITTGAPTVRIGILDSGVYGDHEDMVGNVTLSEGVSLVNVCPVPPQGGLVECDVPSVACGDTSTHLPDDDVLHGTAVASIAAGRGGNAKGMAGVAYGAKIVSIKLLNNDFDGGTSCKSAQGIAWSREHGIPIINMSYLTGSWPDAYDPAELAAARNSFYAGQLLVAASGNENGVFRNRCGCAHEVEVSVAG